MVAGFHRGFLNKAEEEQAVIYNISYSRKCTKSTIYLYSKERQ